MHCYQSSEARLLLERGIDPFIRLQCGHAIYLYTVAELLNMPPAAVQASVGCGMDTPTNPTRGTRSYESVN